MDVNRSRLEIFCSEMDTTSTMAIGKSLPNGSLSSSSYAFLHYVFSIEKIYSPFSLPYHKSS